MGRKLIGAVEAGGTKFVCAVGTGPDDLRDVERFPTTLPEETLARTVEYFRKHAERQKLAAVGIAAFGPVDVKAGSKTWGYITSTPKPGWRDTDFGGRLARELGMPVGFDTDVNGAALAEWRWGAGQGKGVVLYVTIGTGIGGGLVIDGRPLHGLVHPEMGHARLPHDFAKDSFAGACPFHGDCLEGLASGKAMELRWGRAENLPDEHPAWELEAEYLALACQNWICTLSPEAIILGGGVMHRRGLIEKVRARTQVLLAGYVQAGAILRDIANYIVLPGLGDRAGVLGAVALGQAILKE